MTISSPADFADDADYF